MTGIKKVKIDIKVLLFILLLLIPVVNLYINLGFISILISVTYPLIYGLIFIIVIYSVFKKNYNYLLITTVYFLCVIFSNLQIFNNNTITEAPAISILTYNVNAFKHSNNLNKSNMPSKIVEFINYNNPDICVLQESAYKESLKIKGYKYQFLGYRDSLEKSLLIIFSKYPIIDNGFVDFPNTRNNAIYADIVIDSDTVRIYNTHLQSYRLNKNLSTKKIIQNLNTNYSKQIEQAHILKSHIDTTGLPIVICGDFNATALSRPYHIIKQNMNNSYSYRSLMNGMTYKLFEYPMRIDHVLYNDKINLISHKNYNLRRSDHEPIIVKIRLKQ